MAAYRESLIRQIPHFDSLHVTDIGLLSDILHEAGIAAGVFLFREGASPPRRRIRARHGLGRGRRAHSRCDRDLDSV